MIFRLLLTHTMLGFFRTHCFHNSIHSPWVVLSIFITSITLVCWWFHKLYLLLCPLLWSPNTHVLSFCMDWLTLKFLKYSPTVSLSHSIKRAMIELVSHTRYSGISFHLPILSKSKGLLNSTTSYLDTKFLSHSCLRKLTWSASNATASIQVSENFAANEMDFSLVSLLSLPPLEFFNVNFHFNELFIFLPVTNLHSSAVTYDYHRVGF